MAYWRQLGVHRLHFRLDAYRLGWKASPLAREDLDSNYFAVSAWRSGEAALRIHRPS
jgi:hypothetical protein